MFPRDTIGFSIHIPKSGSGDYIVSNDYPTTILGFSFHQSAVSSDSILYCGSTQIYDNFAMDTPYIETHFICRDVLKITKTGNDEAFIVVNYIPRDRTIIPDPIYEYQNASTTRGFTSGEILINYFLFIILVACVFGFMLKFFKGKK